MVFKVGSKVVYPSHGIAEIVGREKLQLDGETSSFLVMEVAQQGWQTAGGMVVKVPEERAEGLGVRPAISKDVAAEVLEVLAVRNVRMPSNWSRRFKNHQEKLRTGDVYQCAEVVRNLAFRMRQANLSAAERTMYAKAKHILVSELAVSWGVNDDDAETRVDGVLDLTDD